MQKVVSVPSALTAPHLDPSCSADLSSVCRQCSVVTLLKPLFYICPVGGSVGWLPHVLCLSPQSRWRAPMFTLYLPAMY